MKVDWVLIKRLKGYKSLVWIGDKLLLCKGNQLFFFEPNEDEISKFMEIPYKINFQIFSGINILNRLLRLHIPYAFYSENYNRLFITAGGIIYTINVEDAIILEQFTLPKGNRVLNMTEVNGLNGFKDGIYFGEYFNNYEFKSVDIYRWLPDEKWQVAHTFNQGLIYHIHNLIADKNRNVLYCLTGDLNEHSAIWEFKIDFKEVIRTYFGSQSYRACVGISKDQKLIYATDSQLENNYLCEINFDNKNSTHSIISELEGSVVYGTQSGDDFIFSTTVEPGNFTTKFSLSALLSIKRGKGIKSNIIYLMSYNLNTKLKKTILKAEKDLLPFSLFQFGFFEPKVSSTEIKYLSVFINATKNHDNSALIFKYDLNAN